MPVDPVVRRRHRRRNLAQAGALLVGMLVLLAVVAWLLAGLVGLAVAGLLAGFTLAFRPHVPGGWVLRSQGAVPLPRAAAPQLHGWLDQLARRAGVSPTPELYYVPSPLLTAFAVGSPDDAAIAVTDGLVRRMSARELVAVLAHEVSHVRANDLWIMNLSDTVARITHGLAQGGLVMLFVSVPLLTAAVWPLVLAVVLSLLPTLMTLLQLALSRAREFDADLGAAALTGDPAGLARALEVLEHHHGRAWERVMAPRGRVPELSLLRTHPPTDERVRRLLSLAVEPGRMLGDDGPVEAPLLCRGDGRAPGGPAV